MAPDEAALVERARCGDAAAFEVLFRRYHGPVFRLCRTYTSSDQDAMDLAQDAFLKAYRGLKRLAKPEAFPAWLYTIARNVARNAVTRRPPPAEALDEAREPASTTGVEDQVLRAEARVLAELQRLQDDPPDSRELQRAINGLSAEEVVAHYQRHTAWTSDEEPGGFEQGNLDFVTGFDCSLLNAP